MYVINNAYVAKKRKNDVIRTKILRCNNVIRHKSLHNHLTFIYNFATFKFGCIVYRTQPRDLKTLTAASETVKEL